MGRSPFARVAGPQPLALLLCGRCWVQVLFRRRVRVLSQRRASVRTPVGRPFNLLLGLASSFTMVSCPFRLGGCHGLPVIGFTMIDSGGRVVGGQAWSKHTNGLAASMKNLGGHLESREIGEPNLSSKPSGLTMAGSVDPINRSWIRLEEAPQCLFKNKLKKIGDM